MANKKFSEFTLKTDSANVDFVVGYDGTDNVRIAPSNLGGGASDLNGLTDCLVTAQASQFIGNVPANVTSGAYNNTSLGHNALELITGGDNNIGIGWNAGSAITDGAGNVIVGRSALSGGNLSETVAIGHLAALNATGSNSTHVGSDAGRANSAAGHISIGYHAGYSQTSGIENTNLGYEAGYNNTTNSFRTCIGWKAGKLNTGTGCTFIGHFAGGDRANIEGSSTAVGNEAGRYWESGSNTALGENAGAYANGTSRYNVMVGRDAIGGAFGSKSNNVGVGYRAGYNLTTGSDNIYIGYEAGKVKTTGDQNTVVGSKALDAETTGQRNTAIGYEALGGQNQTAASHNTAVGWQADDGNTTGYFRTNIGAGTGRGSATGANITNIGYSANESSSSASNEVTLGNSSVATLRCAVTSITSLSDERDKSEIKDLGYGLAFIDALQPREFVWDNRAELDRDGEEFYSANKGKKDFGFIAQEVQELDNDTLRLVYDSNPEKLELSYGKLVPILVQAIKELKAEVELLKS